MFNSSLTPIVTNCFLAALCIFTLHGKKKKSEGGARICDVKWSRWTENHSGSYKPPCSFHMTKNVKHKWKGRKPERKQVNRRAFVTAKNG